MYEQLDFTGPAVMISDIVDFIYEYNSNDKQSFQFQVNRIQPSDLKIGVKS